MNDYHQVEQGQTLATIADVYGFADWRTIYWHPNNAELRRLRPNPDILHPGDLVFVSLREPRIEPAETERRHYFVARVARRLLRLAIEDAAGVRLVRRPFTLTINGQRCTGETSDDGILEHPIPIDSETGSLTVDGFSWTIQMGHLNPIRDTSDLGISGVQARLSNLGYYDGPIDGRAGRLTHEAVRAFQRDNPSLAMDGLCGQETLKLLAQKHGS